VVGVLQMAYVLEDIRMVSSSQADQIEELKLELWVTGRVFCEYVFLGRIILSDFIGVLFDKAEVYFVVIGAADTLKEH